MPFESLPSPVPVNDGQPDGLDLLGFLRRRKSFVVLFSLIGIGISWMLFHRQTRQYRSNAWVQVIHRYPDPMVRSMMAEKDLTDTDFVMRSPRTLTKAFTNHTLGATTTTLRDLTPEEAASRMAGMIATKNLTANIVDVSVTGSEQTDVQLIAEAICQEYVTAQRENYKDASEELKEILTKARDEYFEGLRQAKADYADFRKTTKLYGDGENPYRLNAKSAHEKVSSLELQKTELRAQLAEYESAAKEVGAREAILLLIGKESESATASSGAAKGSDSVASGDSLSSVKSLKETLLPLLVEEANLQANLGPDHPKLKQHRRHIEMVRAHFQQLAGEAATASALAPKAEPQSAPQDFLTIYLNSLRQDLLVVERTQNELQKLADEQDRLARELMEDELENQDRLDAIAQFDIWGQGLAEQLSKLQLNSGMGGVNAAVLQPARHASLVYPVASKFLGMGGFLGALCGLMLGYLVEVADRSFRKPDEIIREFGVPIMGHIPFITEDRMKTIPSDARFDKTAVSVHLPRSQPAEAYRSVRTAVYFSAFGGSHRVLQVTSPAAGDGKSTLALNLALSMAQSGKKTILVESDFRRPKVHKLTGVNNKLGFVDVLRGTVELPDAIQETSARDFYVLPCGTRPKDPSELLTQPVYEEMLRVLREKFEYVIIDTPPVLAVTDPCGVAARVDGVLVCMRLSRHTRELGRRTLDQLREVGATIAGIVINGVEERDAYGYGNYRYSDYRYYYKNYNYKYGAYGANDSREYFAEDSTPELSLLTNETGASSAAER